VLATGQFALSLGAGWIDVMPLHALGSTKYCYLGMRTPFEDLSPDTDSSHAVRLLRSLGLRVTVGRMM